MEEALGWGNIAISIIIVILLFMIMVHLDDSNCNSVYHYDVNNDGKIDARDYVLIKNYIMSEGE